MAERHYIHAVLLFFYYYGASQSVNNMEPAAILRQSISRAGEFGYYGIEFKFGQDCHKF